MGACQSGQAMVADDQALAVPVIRTVFVGPHHAGKTTLVRLISNIVSVAEFTLKETPESDFGSEAPPTSPRSATMSFGHFNTEVMAQARYVKAALLDLAKAYALGLIEGEASPDFNVHMNPQQLGLIKAVVNARDLHVLVNILPKFADLIAELNTQGQIDAYFASNGLDFESISIPKMVEIGKRAIDSSYIPDARDLLFLQWRSTGATWKSVKTTEFELKMCDLAGRLKERENWSKFAPIGIQQRIVSPKGNPSVGIVSTNKENFEVVVFTADSHCFAQNLLEDGTTNRMKDTMALFNQILGDQSLANAHLVVVLTNLDKLSSVIQNRPTVFQQFYNHEGSISVPEAQAIIERSFTDAAKLHGRTESNFDIVSINVFEEQEKSSRTLKRFLKKNLSKAVTQTNVSK